MPTRFRLVRFLLVESLVLAIDGVVVGCALGLALMTAAACGTIPALQASAAAPRTSVFGSDRTASPRRRWPHAFIAAVGLVADEAERRCFSKGQCFPGTEF